MTMDLRYVSVQPADEERPEPKPTAPPFIHLVAGSTPDPADVAVSGAAYAVLVAKGWSPPGTTYWTHPLHLDPTTSPRKEQ